MKKNSIEGKLVENKLAWKLSFGTLLGRKGCCTLLNAVLSGLAVVSIGQTVNLYFPARGTVISQIIIFIKR